MRMSVLNRCDLIKIKNNKKIFGIFLGVVALFIQMGSASAQQVTERNYKTDAWGRQFKYGPYSTLIASHILAVEFPQLLARLGRYSMQYTDHGELERNLKQYQKRYENLSAANVNAILRYANDDRSKFIYRQPRGWTHMSSLINKRFMTNMQDQKYIDALRPSGEVIGGNRIKLPNKWQINVHRTLYNKGYGIHENSLAGIVTGYVAGLRSFEFDVLNTKDNRNVVFHDLVTNRVTGNYESPSVWVEKVDYGKTRNTPFNIINVLNEDIKFQKTSQTVMPTTEEFLYFTHKLLPEYLDNEDFRISLYADARNDSPSSLIKLISDRPASRIEYYRDHTVIKIYSFQYKSGAHSLIEDYAGKYGLSFDEAKSAIADVGVNVLLPVSSALESVDWSKMDDTTLSNFNGDLFESFGSRLPFSADSQADLNYFDGQEIFSAHDLRLINRTTLMAAKYLIDFSAITNVLVYQQSLGPSLKSIIENNSVDGESRKKFSEMSREKKIFAAVTDNVLAIIEGLHNKVFSVDLYTPNGTKRFSDHAPKPVWGLSDRFPDFILARPSSSTAQNSFPLSPVKNIYFAMTGGACEKKTKSDIKKRSLSAIYEKIEELQNSGSSIPVSYITTDIDTDLMASLMGAIENPHTLDDRYYTFVGNTIKTRFLMPDFEYFNLPYWSTKVGPAPAAAEEEVCPVDKVERDEL